MNKVELRKIVDKHTTCLNDFHAIMTAFDAYTEASNDAKPMLADVKLSFLSARKHKLKNNDTSN